MRTVEHQVALADVHVQLLAETFDASRRDDTPHRGIGGDVQQIDVAGGAAAQMLHSSFIVHDHVIVGSPHPVQDVPKDVVDRAVTAPSLGAPHGKKIHFLALCQRVLDLVVQVLLFGHPRT